MILQVRHGKTVFEVEVPRGSQVRRTDAGPPVLIVPGLRVEETATWIDAPEIIGAARRGQHGLAVRSERRLALCR